MTLYNFIVHVLKKYKLALIIFFVGILILLPSCFFSSDESGVNSIKIYYKNAHANYGFYTVYYNNKVYFNLDSNIYTVDSSDNINLVEKNKYGMFCIVDNKIYLLNDTGYSKWSFYSTLLSNIKYDNFFNYSYERSGPPWDDLPKIYFNNQIYIQMRNSGINILKTNNELDNSVIPSDSKIIPFGDSNYALYLTSQGIAGITYTGKTYSLNEKTDSAISSTPNIVFGFMDSLKSFYFPYYTFVPVILSYDHNKGYYILSEYKLYLVNETESNLLGEGAKTNNTNLLFSNEDNQYFYVIRGDTNDFQELLKINKSTGQFTSIYRISSGNENFVALTSSFAVLYNNGVLTKISNINGSIINSKVLESNKQKLNGYCGFEQCDKFLYIDNNEGIKILDLDNMNEVKLP